MENGGKTEEIKRLASSTDLHNNKCNLENFKIEVENLKNVSRNIQNMVDEAKSNGEEIEENVQKWMERASKIIDEASQKIIEDGDTAKKRCLKGLFPALKTGYQLSKEAVTQLEAVVRHREAGSFDTISRQKDSQLSDNDFQYFQSRKSTLMELVRALNDPNVNMIGIYGMGGVGKTTLVKEAALQTKRNKIFDQVVFANISQNADIRKIQGEIGDKLGLTLLKMSESTRASKLGKRLKKEKKILIILDNIWGNFDLSLVGIPARDDHKGCKLLLISRSLGPISEMNTQLIYKVHVLNKEESWSLFKKMAGEYIEGSELKPVATEVVEICAGLPIAIVAVAKALKNKSLIEWKGALQELRSSSLESRDSVLYSIIELSYNYLESGILKKTFLVIGYANLTSIDDLLIYSMSLGLFEGIKGLEERKVRVRRLVQHLKDSHLLLGNIPNNEEFSMHEVVRDVAVSIASRKHQLFTAKVFDELKWPDENTLKGYPAIVLENVNTQVISRVLECQQAKLLSISAADSDSLSEIHDKFFASMAELKGLVLTNLHLWSLPSSLCFLTNLQTLGLFNCSQLNDIAIIGDLKKLEILCLRGCDIRQLPAEVGQLTQLVSLDLRNCNKLKVIPPNVISRLSHLEELYIGRFSKWDVEDINKERRNASLNELKHLSKLISLEIYIKDANTVPKDLFFDKLEKYNISIGGLWSYNELPKISRTFKLEISNDSICLNDTHIMQLKGIKHLYLAGLTTPSALHQRPDETNLEDNVNVSDTLFNGKVVIPNLETLELYQINVERIWQNQVAVVSCGIQNLARLIVNSCSNLRCLFSSSMVSSLVRLQYLEICDCPHLEEIIVVDDELREEEMKSVALPMSNINNYLNVKVEDCDKLQTIFPQNTVIKFLRLASLSVSHCRSLEVIFDLEGLNFEKTNGAVTQLLELNIVGLPKLRHVWNKDPKNSLSFQKLNTVNIVDCYSLKNVFPVSLAGSLSQLKILHISRCGVEEIVFVSEEGAKETYRFVFDRVTSLTLKNLLDLKTFFPGKHSIVWPALKKLQVCGLGVVKIFTLQSSEGRNTLSQQPNFLHEEVFPKFEELILRGKDLALMSDQLPNDLLSKLKYLSFKFDEPAVILSLDFLHRLSSKKILQITGFSSNIRKYNNKIENGVSILGLNICPGLKHIFKEKVNMDNLVQLKVLWCDNLIQLVESSTSFGNLTTLEISYCKGLKNLITSSTAKSLEQLRTMNVDSCSLITEIVADEGDVATVDEIIFGKLKELKLKYLESFTCFCSGNYTLHFPSLEELNVVKCPKMKFFSGGVLSTPNLHKVKQDWFDKVGVWKDDLNTTIQELHGEMEVQSSKEI